MDLRPQNGAHFLQSKPSFTVADILSGKESTHMLLADRVLPDFIADALASGDPIAQAAAAVLAAWDRNSDATSIGAVLFEGWGALVTSATPASVCHPSLPGLALDNTINFYSPHPKFSTNGAPPTH